MTFPARWRKPSAWSNPAPPRWSLTLGAGGAIVATADQVIHSPAFAVSEKTGVGAGDSFLAGLVFGLSERRPLGDALRLALACGASAVQNAGTAAVRRAAVDALLATTIGQEAGSASCSAV